MKVFVLIPVCLFTLGLSAQSGILKTVGGAAKNKVKQQDFNSTRTNKERGMLHEDKKSSPAPALESAPEQEDTTMMPGAAKYESSYTFGEKISYDMEDLSNAKHEKQTITYYYSKNAVLTSLKEGTMSMIMDFENESMINISEENKTATAMSAKWASQVAESEAKSDATVTKTGKKKTILGYNCEEYVVLSEDSKSVVWVTTEITLDYAESFLAMSKSSGSKSGWGDFEGQGMMMEMTAYDRKGAATTHMIMTEYKKETLVKTLSDYKVSAF